VITSRTITLDDSGAGTVGMPPSRYAGFRFPSGSSHAIQISNMGRDLANETAAEDLLLPPDTELVNGEILVSGGPAGEDVTLFFEDRSLA
jgi:hypothetical protein